MDYIGEAGVPMHSAGHVINLSFSNIPIARTEVMPDIYSGSDHETLVTTIPGRGSIPIAEQVHLRSRAPSYLSSQG